MPAPYQRFIRPGLNETDHVNETLAADSGAILGRYLSRQCGNNLFSIFGSRRGKDITVNPDANSPIHHHEFGVYAFRNANTRRINDFTNIASNLPNPFQRGGDTG